MVSRSDIFHIHTEIFQEVDAIFLPVSKPLQICSRFAEEFQLHLFKLSRSKCEVSGSYLVSKRFSYLGYSERNFFSRSPLNVPEIDEDALSSFRSQVYLRLRVFCNSLKGLEHQVELAYARKVGLAALGTCDLVLSDVFFEFLVRPAVYYHIFDTVLVHIFFYQLISPESGLAALAVYQRI